MRARSISAVLARCSFAVIFAVCIALLISLGAYGPEREDLNGWGRAFLVWGGVAMVLFSLLYSRKSIRGLGGVAEFRDAVRFFGRYSGYPLALGGIIGIVLAGLILSIPPSLSAAPSERVVEAVTVFIASLISFVGIDAFYRRHAPITQMPVLLDNLAQDVRRAMASGQEITLAYPALNLGFYRMFKDHGGIPDEHPYIDYRNAFSEAALRLNGRLRVLTYPTKLYKRLFRCYHDQVLDGAPPEGHMDGLEVRATEEAQFFADRLSAGSFRGLSPLSFPEGVIVAGDVVYMVHTYGMPQYEPALNEDPYSPESADGFFLPVEENLAELVVYRREDPLLAKAVLKHIDRLVQTADTHVPRNQP